MEQARLTTSWVSLTNQFFLISDWLPSLPDERIAILKRTMAPHHGTARPVDYFDHRLPAAFRVVALRAAEGRPVLLSVSSHVTQGITDATHERWADNTLSGTLETRADEPTELRIRVPDGWKMAESKARRMKPGDGAVSVSATGAHGLVRMTVSAAPGTPVAWSVRFVPVAR